MSTDIKLWNEGVDLRCRGLPRNCAYILSTLNVPDSALNIEKRLRADSVRRVRAQDRSRSIETCWTNTWGAALSSGRLAEWEQFLTNHAANTNAFSEKVAIVLKKGPATEPAK